MFFNKNSLKAINKEVSKILALKPKMEAMSDEELKNQTSVFKERLSRGESLDRLLPEAFATVREVSRRVLHLEHFHVQLIGGIALHRGLIAEMKTGEGKTLVSTCPGYLNALTGKPVYIVTVNDYLAKRDAETMGQVYEALGMTVGVVLNRMSQAERKAAYASDVTYVTNNELGFDYLRDNMATSMDQKVLRNLEYCIIDEVDSVLIDEARTPLIISGQSDKSTSLYIAANLFAKKLVKGESRELTKMDVLMGEDVEETGDFIIDEKDKRAYLTADGVKKAEMFFHITNLSDPENVDIQHHINLALRANYLMSKNKDYIEKDGGILIVDEFTGRTMPGRRYSDGLHQAIEAKEHVEIKKESKTYASITFQNFFNKFKKKAGMTGTAKTEEKEFKNIYNLPVLVIPTNKPVIRIDEEDVVYKTKKEKYRAIIKDAKECYERKQPVLIGTVTIETSELLSQMLKREGIPHNVLNAKYVEREAEIIQYAGQHGAVTIATNMAGRGTDICLDKEAKELGGLKIIGTERHESRRIDNQLRGRSGRQGDPGISVFYLSLEDDLMRIFGSDRIKDTFENMGIEENEEIKHKMVTRSIETAQKRIENNNFGIREQLLKFDETNNEQMDLIYSERDQIMVSDSLSELLEDMMYETGSGILKEYIFSGITEESLTEAIRHMRGIIPLEIDITKCAKMKEADLLLLLRQEMKEKVADFEEQFEDPDLAKEAEKRLLLRIIDQKWMDHLSNLEKLKETIRLQAYGQKNPITEYKLEAYQMFDEMLENISEAVAKAVCHTRILRRAA